MKRLNFYTNWNKADRSRHKKSSHDKNRRYCAVIGLLIFAALLLFLWNIGAGSVRISLSEVCRILAGRKEDATAQNIIWQIRFPRAAAAMILGGALALAGYLLQTFFHNPIAGPFVLGISSGAKLSVALVMVLLVGKGTAISSLLLILAAFVGALLSMGFVILVSGRVKRMSMLIVCGVMIGYICSAVTDIIVTFAADTDIVNLHNWSLGSFSGMTWSNVTVMAILIFTVLVITFFLSKPIGAYQLGESYARNMGVNITAFRVLLVLLSSILAACVTAFAGPVSFVGIAVPQLVKYMLRTTKPILMIPASFLGGAVFCLFCDLLARTLFAPTELSISTVTAVFGVPVVLAVMLQQKKQQVE